MISLFFIPSYFSVFHLSLILVFPHFASFFHSFFLTCFLVLSSVSLSLSSFSFVLSFFLHLSSFSLSLCLSKSLCALACEHANMHTAIVTKGSITNVFAEINEEKKNR